MWDLNFGHTPHRFRLPPSLLSRLLLCLGGRTLTADELREQERQRLEALEKERIKRMAGEEEEDDDAAGSSGEGDDGGSRRPGKRARLGPSGGSPVSLFAKGGGGREGSSMAVLCF